MSTAHIFSNLAKAQEISHLWSSPVGRTYMAHIYKDTIFRPRLVKFRIADDSGLGGDERVYQGLSEPAQSRLTSLDNLTIRGLIGL